MQSGGHATIICGALSANEIKCLMRVEETMYASRYIHILDNRLFLRSCKILCSRPQLAVHTYQNDNAPTHKAELTQNVLDYKRINTMEWTANSKDLNSLNYMGDDQK